MLAQHQHESFEQQRETRQFPTPRRFDLAHAPVRELQTRHPHLQETLVLKEVQVPVALANGVVDGMLAIDPRHGKATAGGEVHADRQRPGHRVKVRARYIPGRGYSQRHLKQLVRHAQPYYHR